MIADSATRRTGIASTLGLYLRPQVLIVALLGFSAGLPLALSGATLSVWMADRGVDLGTIGLLSLAGLPYTLKFLWAPLVDALDVPILSAWLGRRRGWLIACQLALMAAILFLGTRDPVAAPLAIGLGAMLVAAASATQDIVIDAFRIDQLAAEEQAAGMASYVATYRVGMLVSGAGVIGLTAWLEALGMSKSVTWPIAFAVAAALVVVGMVAVLLARKPVAATPGQSAAERPAAVRVAQAATGAFRDFLTRDAALIVAFVVLFKLCDALAGVMTGPFVLALGYDKATYAGIVKGGGLAASLLGGFAGGFVAAAMPLGPALWLAACLQAASNLVFIWLASVPVHTGVLATAIVIENFTGGIGTVIFVAYLSALCSRPGHTATQYALLTALASVGRTLIAATSGYAAAQLGWAWFFAATTIAAAPGLLLLAWLQSRGHFQALAREKGHRATPANVPD